MGVLCSSSSAIARGRGEQNALSKRLEVVRCLTFAQHDTGIELTFEPGEVPRKS